MRKLIWGEAMAEHSKIEWTDHTFNPWTGCTKISAGCDHCYAETWARRSAMVQWGNYPRRRTTSQNWRSPLKWQADAVSFEARFGRRQRVFTASLADVFDNQVPGSWRADLFELIKTCPSLDFLVLTKRPQNIQKMLPSDWGAGYPNVWLGITAEDQASYDARGPIIDRINAAVKFISYEPAIGPLRLSGRFLPDWLIIGGESGGNARPMNADWVHDIIDDCHRLNVAPFFKQWGTWKNNPLSRVTGCSPADDPDGKGGGRIGGRLVRKFPIYRPERIVAAAAE